MTAPDIVDHGFRVKLDEISLDDSSGWRPAQAGVVREFYCSFQSTYMATLHRPPRLLVSSTKSPLDLMMDSAGKYMLDDGKSTIKALMQLKAEYAAGTLGPCCEKLTQVLVSGELVVQAVHYPSGDTLERFAFNAHAHDEENNTFMPTTVATKIKLIKSIKATVPGGEWNLVQTWLEGRYGVAKRSSIKRTITAAKCVSDRVV
eukprot:6481274-Pyramimonas_sp.AAC.1